MTTTTDAPKGQQAKVLPNVPPPIAMLRFLGGFRVARIIYVVAELGIADLLADEPKSVAELAQATEAHEQSLYRVMRSLASVGIFAEDEGKFKLTPPAEFLRGDTPGSLRDAIKFLGQDWHWEVWGELPYSIETGKPAFDHLFGQGLFDFYLDPEAAKTASDSKVSISSRASNSLLTNYDFSDTKTVVELGIFAGAGSTLIPLLKAHPQMKGILFDFESAIAAAKPAIEQAGLSDRCELVAGECVKTVPSGGDTYILMFTIHNWDDERAIKILQNCRQGITDTGKLLLVEMILPEGNEPFVGKLIDIESLLTTPGGRERKAEEYRDLLTKAGFEVSRIIPTQTANSIIEAVPV
ncbi:methyltransferase [Pleurocapsales cyanobacterium LEGE 10410]|nr:methyltransferase [Pleurocapsales cyanobacterium LEGE 10410]